MPLFSKKNCKIKVKLRQSLNLFCFKLTLAKIRSHYFYNISEFIKYCPAIKLYSFFSIALEEARDINIHLKPLRRLLDDMEQFDFSELEKIIPAILHTVGLIWANSKYYCRAPRMIVLLQELCNMLIEMVSSQ